MKSFLWKFFKTVFKAKTFCLSLLELIPLRNEAQERTSKTTPWLSQSRGAQHRPGSCSWAGPSSLLGLATVTAGHWPSGHHGCRKLHLGSVQNELYPRVLSGSRLEPHTAVLAGDEHSLGCPAVPTAPQVGRSCATAQPPSLPSFPPQLLPCTAARPALATHHPPGTNPSREHRL